MISLNQSSYIRPTRYTAALLYLEAESLSYPVRIRAAGRKEKNFAHSRPRGSALRNTAADRLETERKVNTARLRAKESKRTSDPLKAIGFSWPIPANFIHGELSRLRRQWTPLRLIVRTGKKKDRHRVWERESTIEAKKRFNNSHCT